MTYRTREPRFGPFNDAPWWDRFVAQMAVSRGAYNDLRVGGLGRIRAAVAGYAAAREVFTGWTEPMTLSDLHLAGQIAVRRRLP